MYEITTTRMNPGIDPQLHVWGWEIPVYLFLGGLVAGMMVISGYFQFSGRYRESNSCACFTAPLVGLVLLSLGMLALFLDLEHKLFTWRLYTTFQITSPMSWGAWILLLVYPVQIVSLLLRVPDSWSRGARGRTGFLVRLAERADLTRYARGLGAANMALGALLGMYTGVLLSTLGARPLWSSAILWLLFLVSGLSSAAALVHLIARSRAESELLAKADNFLLMLELAVVGLFLIGLSTSGDAGRQAAQMLLSGAYAPVFWVFVIGLGIVVPLTVQLMAVNHRIRHVPAAPVLVIAGGLILRFVIVYAGQASHWPHIASSVTGF